MTSLWIATATWPELGQLIAVKGGPNITWGPRWCRRNAERGSPNLSALKGQHQRRSFRLLGEKLPCSSHHQWMTIPDKNDPHLPCCFSFQPRLVFFLATSIQSSWDLPNISGKCCWTAKAKPCVYCLDACIHVSTYVFIDKIYICMYVYYT